MERIFDLRLTCTYEGEHNDVARLDEEILVDGEWHPLDLSIRSPGFLLMVAGLFSCQHLYMRVNCAECGVLLSSTSAELHLKANEIWEIQEASVTFRAQLKQGLLSDKQIAYIQERMQHCPVSSNLPPHVKVKSTLEFIPVA
ncbi:MAG: hypothetical protein ACWA5Q_06190 [bacterium]